MPSWGLLSIEPLLQALQFVENELTVFALFWFVVGALDELAIDLVWLKLRLTGRATTPRLPRNFAPAPLASRIAVLFPAWREADVIGAAVSHTLAVWPQAELRIYVGCYPNDVATVAAAMTGIGRDQRARVVVLDRAGPTTKADCLNRLYASLMADEARSGQRYGGIILHDAEDMVHPAGLELTARALQDVDFVQLPVRPEPQAKSRWVAGHYGDEFTESHAKGLIVRQALGAAIPAAGVGCGFSRDILEALVKLRRDEGETGPFAAECLTEDYELGWLITRLGGRSRFLRVRDADGELIATRAYFPATIVSAVRQKTRWIHGIAFQSWDRLGWSNRLVDIWMALRDRRAPLTAFVLTAAYVLVAIWLVLAVARMAGWQGGAEPNPYWRTMLWTTFLMLAWRGGMRLAFTTREYGLMEGLRSVPRIVVGNAIAILASQRAMMGYFRSLGGAPVTWDKTTHTLHPAKTAAQESPA